MTVLHAFDAMDFADLGYGHGFHDVIMGELELGRRVYMAIDEEMCWGGLAWWWKAKEEEGE